MSDSKEDASGVDTSPDRIEASPDMFEEDVIIISDDEDAQLDSNDDDDCMDAVAFLCTSFAIPGGDGDDAMDVDRSTPDAASGRGDLDAHPIVPYSASASGQSRASVIQQVRETVIHQARKSVFSGTCVPVNVTACVPAAVHDAEGDRGPLDGWNGVGARDAEACASDYERDGVGALDTEAEAETGVQAPHHDERDGVDVAAYCPR